MATRDAGAVSGVNVERAQCEDEREPGVLTVTRGYLFSQSARIQRWIVQLPKLIARVRFPSPARMVKAQVAKVFASWALFD